MSKEYGKTVVDVHSLEDFTKALDNHHSAVTAMLKTIDGKLASPFVGCTAANPDSELFGGFPDGRETNQYYTSTASEYRARIKRLQSAIEAAQRATASILDTYRSTEDRNDASARDIARTVNPVGTALKGA